MHCNTVEPGDNRNSRTKAADAPPPAPAVDVVMPGTRGGANASLRTRTTISAAAGLRLAAPADVREVLLNVDAAAIVI